MIGLINIYYIIIIIIIIYQGGGGGVNIRHNWKPFLWRLKVSFYLSISYCKDNIKCDSALNAIKCPLNNSVFVVQILVVKLSNTSTMLFPPVKKTLSNLVEVFESLTTSFERWTRRCLVDI